jgi:hypothetical protein
MAPTDAVDGADADEAATRLVVSYPADLSDWGRMQVEKPSFRAFLRKTRETAAAGDDWTEFVGVGCCGDSLDVPLRVERVDGGATIDAETEITFSVRAACDLDGGWLVQSEAAPE